MATNEQDILARIAARRAATVQNPDPDDLAQRIAARRAAQLTQMLFSPEKQQADESYVARPTDTMGTALRDYARNIATGVPFSDEIEGAVSALPALWPGGETFSESRARNTEEARTGRETFAREMPAAAAIGKGVGLVGSAMLTAPVLASRPLLAGMAGGAAYMAGDADDGNRLGGAAVGAGLGLAGAGLAKAAPAALRTLLKPTRAAAVGGGIAAVHSLGDDQTGLRDMGSDIVEGAGALAAPAVIGRKVGPRLLRGLASRIADEGVTDAIRAGTISSGAAREMIERAGPQRAGEIRALDLSPDLTAQARGAMGVWGSRARTELPEMAEARLRGEMGRTVADLERGVGQKSGQAAGRLRGMVEARGSEADGLYAAARAQPDLPRDDVDALLKAPPLAPYVDDAAKRWERAEFARAARTGERPAPWNPRSVAGIDLIKRSIDDDIAVAQRAGRKNEVRDLMGLKEAILAPLDTPYSASHRPMYTAARAEFERRSQPIDANLSARGLLRGPNRTKSFTQSSDTEVAEQLFRMDPATRAEYRIAALDDLVARLSKTSNPSRTLFGRGAGSPEERKLRMLLTDDAAFDQLSGAQAVERQFGTTAKEIGPTRGSRTPFAFADIANFGKLSDLASEVLREMVPNLSTSARVADEVAAINQLQGDDLIRYLQMLEERMRQQAINRGRENVAAGAVGFAAPGLAGPLVSGERDRQTGR